ncbi:MAG: AMP-binding protein [Muribaculaceae bacterium]|nr:AMP-binding protein [Muribaculaceae bacterium]
MKEEKESLIPIIEQSIRDNWERPALTNFRGVTFQYRDLARKVAKLHLLYEHAGLQPGERIAICGRNSAQWAVAMISVVTYGCVAVPILPDFKPDSIHHLVNHSDARFMFADNSIWENLDPEQLPDLVGVLRLGDFSLLLSRSDELGGARSRLNELFGCRYPERFTPDDVCYVRPAAPDMMLINYTSGSTGFSKGVVLPHRSLLGNVEFCQHTIGWLEPGDRMVSVLPLGHMYGLAIELFYPICTGCHVTFLTRTPAPRVIMEAMADIQPKLVTTVPLVLEKIIRSRVLPLFEKRLMRLLLRTPGLNARLMARARAELERAFGANVREVIIGGAPLNREIEEFLDKIQFPYANVYGMTECGPFISYMSSRNSRVASCGLPVPGMEVRVDSPDPAAEPGVLWVRGKHMMDGYFKNREATEAVMRDGWMSTGDIANIDAEGFVYIRGRNKNMILGANGQNIYPEEIESKLNNMPYVAESIVIDRGGKLVALIYPDLDAARVQSLGQQQLQQTLRENITVLNAELPRYSQISDFNIYQEEFEKTAKRSIKRYLYK